MYLPRLDRGSRAGRAAICVAGVLLLAAPCFARDPGRFPLRSGADPTHAARWVAKAIPAPQDRFLAEFLQPRLEKRLDGVAPAVRSATDALSLTGDPRWPIWNDALVDQARRGSIRAFRGAVKDWLVDQVVFDRLSLPMGSRAAAADERPRLRFGIAHLAPRIGVAWTTRAGEMDWGIDARGNVGLGFAMSGDSRLRFRAEASPRQHHVSARFVSSF